MLKNYLGTTLRVIWLQRMNSVVKIVGLALSLALCLLTYLMLENEFSFDAFHQQAARLYRVDHLANVNSEPAAFADAPVALFDYCKKNAALIPFAARLGSERFVVKYRDNLFNEQIHFADPDFLEMFSFPLKLGTAPSFRENATIFLSQETAQKYFGPDNAIGKQLVLRFGEHERSFAVGAVFEKLPRNSSITFQMLLPFDNWFDLHPEGNESWRDFTGTLFVQLSADADVREINKMLSTYTPLAEGAMTGRKIERFYLEPLREIRFNEEIQNTAFPTATRQAYYFMVCSVFGLLLIGAFNFVNLSVGAATSRLKEIGVRKVMGATRFHLARQFLPEHTLICFFALVLGIAGAELLLPQFNQFYVSKFDYHDIFRAQTLLFLLILLFVTTILSGAYPAFYVAAFESSRILRREQVIGGRQRFSRLLIGFQFMLSSFLIVIALVLFEQNRLLANLDIGYDSKAVIVVDLQDRTVYDRLRAEALKRPGVLAVAGSDQALGSTLSLVSARMGDEKFDVLVLASESAYFETMGMKLRMGTIFDKASSSDIVVNEALMQRFHWHEPVGKRLELGGRDMTVSGVVADFFTRDYGGEPMPVVIVPVRPAEISYASIRTVPEKMGQTMDNLKNIWQRLAPDTPFQAFYQDEVFADTYLNMHRVEILSATLALTTIFVACIGLFALTSLRIAKRTKEIGVRKVLGASIFNVTYLVARESIYLTLAASLAAWPFAYQLAASLLQLYYKRIDLTPGFFLESTGIILLLTFLTVSTQAVRAALANPVEALRYE